MAPAKSTAVGSSPSLMDMLDDDDSNYLGDDAHAEEEGQSLKDSVWSDDEKGQSLSEFIQQLIAQDQSIASMMLLLAAIPRFLATTMPIIPPPRSKAKTIQRRQPQDLQLLY